MEIAFKNVNQGDSILLSWGDPVKYGIIDCSSENGNPILEHIKLSGCRELEFIILSHPHTDHFSGFCDLLSYLTVSNVPVKIFGMTFDSVVSDVLAKFYSSNSQGILYRFFEAIYQDKKSKTPIIKRWMKVGVDTADLELGDGYKLIFRTPSISEIDDVLRAYEKVRAGKSSSAPDANFFSSIIELKKETDSVLLTSDAPKSYFAKLDRYYGRIDHTFHLVQVPHHGSRANHFRGFWERISRIDECPAVFSVGDDKHDKLPNIEVVDDFLALGYDIHSTNEVYGIKTLTAGSGRILPAIFDVVSTPVASRTAGSGSSSKFRGEQVFRF